MAIFDAIAQDTERREAAIVDDRTGLAAYIVQDPDPMAPDEWTDDRDDPAWDTYRNGDVYGIVIVDAAGEHLDSVWSMYDDQHHAWRTDTYTYETALEMLGAAVEQYTKSAAWVAI